MFEPSQAFLRDFISSRGADDLIAGVKKLPRGKMKEGYSAPYADPITDPGSRYWDRMPPGHWEQEEPPNPFGGGSDPYLPGAMMPGDNSNLMAAVLGEPNRRFNRTTGQSIEKGPYTDINRARQDAQDALKRDLLEYPNPFGGGSAPYVRGV